MNYGFADLEAKARPLELLPPDEQDRLAIQLYQHVAGTIDLRGSDVLEVGCGRGGGSSYIMRYLKPRSLIGVDLSRRTIEFCQKRHALPGLSFACGDAEALPFRDGTFDAVVNVESSHCYGSMARFLSEAHRVLRPQGFLLFADLRDTEGIMALRQDLRASGMEVQNETVITRNVLRALEEDNERKVALIERLVPRLWRGPVQQFAGLKGTRMYEALRNGQVEYLSCVLRKNSRWFIST